MSAIVTAAATRRALASLLASAEIAGEDARTRLFVVPSPRLAPLDVLRATRKGEAWWLEHTPPHEPQSPSQSVLGLGAATRTPLHAQPADALAAHHHAATTFTRAVHADADSALAARLPLTLFGHAFAADDQVEEPWRDHRNGCAITPRWTYLTHGDAAVIALACSGALDEKRIALLLAELEAIGGAPQSQQRPQVGRVAIEGSSAAAYHDRVEAARAAIGRAELTKVVCSRCASVCAEHDFAAEDVFERLPPAALRYFVRRGQTTLLGASPERLFRKHANHLVTEALAGTRAEGSAASEQGLLGSEKDQIEHAPVVQAIVSRLSALGARVSQEPSARLHRAANVVHLRTAIEAELPDALGASEILRALHPTPAVGGTPREAAEAFIRAHEPPRGWYSGPIGWIDAHGDADVHVMLRCGLVRGASAWLFAGGGIVASSEPEAELVETELKMAPMLRALGVEPRTDVPVIAPAIGAPTASASVSSPTQTSPAPSSTAQNSSAAHTSAAHASAAHASGPRISA